MTTRRHEQGFDYIVDLSPKSSLINFPDYQRRTILKTELIDTEFDIELYLVYYVDFQGDVHQASICKNIYDRCKVSESLVRKYIR